LTRQYPAATFRILAALSNDRTGVGLAEIESSSLGALLTETQTELVETAIEQGYYDTPRTCSLTDLGREVDIAKSTASETLHRAEEKIIKQFVGEETTPETEQVALRA